MANVNNKRAVATTERDPITNNDALVGAEDYCWGGCEKLTDLDICRGCSAVYCTDCAAKTKWHNLYACANCDLEACSDCQEDQFYKTITTHCIECREEWKEERRERRAELRAIGEELDDNDYANSKKELV